MNLHRWCRNLADKLSASFLCLLLVILCQACSHLQTRPAIPAQTFHFQDGGTARYFSLDKRLEADSSRIADGQIASYLFVVSGSDCIDMQPLLPQYFRGLEGESGAIRIFILQKRFIQSSRWNFSQTCSADFIQADHPQRWLADQSEFIHAQLALAAATGAVPKRIALLGISEGGDIVPTLAHAIPRISHLAILGNGGMDTLAAYRLQAQKHGFAEQLDALEALNHRPAEPDAGENFIAGRSWRYWAELRDLQQSRQLLALDIPILIGMGTADQSVPVESALYTRTQAALQQRHNLTVLLYPEADHGLRSTDHNHLPDFLFALDNLLQK